MPVHSICYFWDQSNSLDKGHTEDQAQSLSQLIDWVLVLDQRCSLTLDLFLVETWNVTEADLDLKLHNYNKCIRVKVRTVRRYIL